jgi:hypothetical protein
LILLLVSGVRSVVTSTHVGRTSWWECGGPGCSSHGGQEAEGSEGGSGTKCHLQSPDPSDPLPLRRPRLPRLLK